MTTRQKSKDSLESAATEVPYKKRKITLASLIIALSVSIAIEIGFSATFSQALVPLVIHTNMHYAQQRY
jgi:hypothetical protein